MLIKKRFYQNPNFWRRVLIVSPIVLYVWWFRAELWLLVQFVIAFLTFFIRPNVTFPLGFDLLRALLVIIYTLGGGFLLYLALLYLAAYFVLPVENHEEHRLAFNRLWLYFRGKHGPAMFIRNGAKVASPEELNKPGPGLAVISMNSAVVLEKRVGFAPHKAQSAAESLVDKVSGNAFRVEGPGIAFLSGGQAIRKVVDLRNQSRSLPNIYGMTRDGIEVKTTISTTFTLGQPPPLLKVAYIGGDQAEHLRVVEFTEKIVRHPMGQRERLLTLKTIVDELDSEDKQEIHRVAKNLLADAHTASAPAAPSPPKKKPFWTAPVIPKIDSSPFRLYKDRIFAAILSQPLEKAHATDLDAEKRYIDWRDLPPRVGADVFRNLIARHHYDKLFEPSSPSDHSLAKVKGQFAGIMRNLGMISVQVVRRKDHLRLIEGWKGSADELTFLPPHTLETPKVLRSRGIVIVSAGFGDITPVSNQVRESLMQNWLAYWKRDKEQTLAQHELSALRAITAERALVQRDMAFTFARLMQSSEYSQEALTWRLFQSLEALAADPETRKLLPDTTIQTMTNLREWLLQTTPPAPEPVMGVSLPAQTDSEAAHSDEDQPNADE